MRLLVPAMCGACLCAGVILAQTPAAREPVRPAAPAVDAKDAAAIASYGIGMSTGRSIKDDGVEIDLEAFIQGIRDGSQGAKPKYTDQQLRAAMTAFRRDMQAKQEDRAKAAGEKNRREGQAFLAKNKGKEGVKTLASGLQYEVVQAGKGQVPKATDTVKVHYEGTLLDGTVFDSSIKRKEPATFPVRGVIPAWTEALQLMHVGDKWKLFVPAELAYGAEGAGRDIGPNCVLTFEVELLGIEAPAARRPLRLEQAPQE